MNHAIERGSLSLSDLDAILVCEGVEEPQSEEHLIECWQHLVDTGLAWTLQGWFGRTASRLIEKGIIKNESGMVN